MGASLDVVPVMPNPENDFSGFLKLAVILKRLRWIRLVLPTNSGADVEKRGHGQIQFFRAKAANVPVLIFFALRILPTNSALFDEVFHDRCPCPHGGFRWH